ncbi:glutamine synthetase III [Candidatus Dependentiae bacterium]|nr:glutamine synthetase III [Candidatus Dependentiae bacterium]
MRKDILKKLGTTELRQLTKNGISVASYFGENVFDIRKMEKYLSRKTIIAFKNWINNGIKIDMNCADEIAEAMKNWAITMGATHYTHWFQPMTGMTAEKHDSFIKLNSPGQVLEEFSGNKLISGEPDASSFPSGGIRSTFEARGYTAWDPSSPAFIMESAYSKTLCIPSIFISYTGEALDKKLPLLRSDEAVNKAAVKLLKIFGKDVKKVFSTCGAEQEYFLIDRNYFNIRQDLLLCNRSLIGAQSPKGQQLEDQYFGSIKERVLNYMKAVEEEAYKCGIPLTTRHNEVAPNQFEFAPIFEESNLAADHNQLLMNIMKSVAHRFGLVCLLHEKPFAGVNGSGKHLNWSLSDEQGNNLLSPGETPEDNLKFLTFIVAVLRAVYKHADLLYSSIVSAGNEHRLGANEAPPAIISVFLGDYISNLLDEIEAGKKTSISKKNFVDFEVGRLPKFIRDNTDRNRTSPFAFTGSKFEFRAVGSSHNIATPITFINTIIAESLDYLSEQLNKRISKDKDNFEDAVFGLLKEIIKETKNIRFEGNNYSQEWVEEAKKRGLKNEPSAAKALKALIKPENIKMFEKYKVFNSNEISARYHIWVELYCTLLIIEANTIIEMANANAIPDALDYQKLLLENLKSILDIDGLKYDNAAIEDLNEHLGDVSNKIYYVRKNVKLLSQILINIKNLESEEKSERIFKEMKPMMEHIRKHIDELELVVPDRNWSLPKYREMLFLI